ncbi:MAG: HD-GYP domain-containing protein [Brevinema sp.]
MPKPTQFSMDILQVGMHFTGALSNRKGEILLPPFHPVQHEHLRDWRHSRFDDVFTTGQLIEDISELRHIVPGHIDGRLAQLLEMYYSSLETLKNQLFGNFSRIDISILQKTASLWTDILVKEQDPHLYLKVLRYATPDPKDYFAAHLLDVAILSMAILYRTERSTVRLMQIALSGLLFDIGMLRFPKEFLNPDTVYTSEMKRELQKHPIYGYQTITKEFALPPIFGVAALEHHERFDGSGYPRQLSGPRISQASTIIGLSDIFTAQIRDREGKISKEPVEALKDFASTSLSLFNPEITSVFLNFLTVYPVSSMLLLSTGEMVIVTETLSYAPLRPTVAVLFNADGSRDIQNHLIPLSEEQYAHVEITGVFNRELLDQNESFHIKPVLSYDAPASQNPNMDNIGASRSSDPSIDGNKEISISL